MAIKDEPHELVDQLVRGVLVELLEYAPGLAAEADVPLSAAELARVQEGVA